MYRRRPSNLGLLARVTLNDITFLLLWLFVFSVPFERVLMVPAVGTISKLIAAILLPVGLLSLVARRSFRPLSIGHWLITAFVLWSTASCLWSVSPDVTVERASTLLQLLVVIFLVSQFCSTEDAVRRLMMAFVLGTLVSCSETIIRFLTHQTTFYDRYAANGFDPNDLSLVLSLSIPISYYLFLRSHGPKGLGWLVQIAAVTVSSVLTASRSGAVAMLCSFSILPLTVGRLNGTRRAALLVLAVLAGFSLTFVPGYLWERLGTTMGEVAQGTLHGRTAIWAGGLRSFSMHPFLGVGAGAFAQGVDPLLFYPVAGYGYVAHNTFVSVLVELGAVGVLIFLALLGSVAIAAMELDCISRRAWLVTLFVWVVGVSTLSWEHRKPTWILFALVLQHAATRRGTRAVVSPSRIYGQINSRVKYAIEC